MSAPISYEVQSGETLLDISKKLGIKDWMQLKQYHNRLAGPDNQTSDIPYAGFKLLVPPENEVYEMNGEAAPKDPKEEQKEAERRQENEKTKEQEEKQQQQASKSEHYGKYFVVHNAKCACNKAENPSQTADLQVTTHNVIVLNDNQTKLAATEEDTTFNPPAATFGKCTLKPSSSGNLPCALAAAPKWSKTYESTKILGKNTLTEISELQCMVGGKISIVKHGQTDAVINAHADNTNPLELSAVNPAVDQPKKKEEYPVVTSVTLKTIENRLSFKELDSKIKEVVYLRKNEEAFFIANLKSGNKQLTSWVIYSDHEGKTENRLFLREQIGTEFSQSFAEHGKFRVEGYGKPKSPDFENGKYDKCDPSCSIDIEVVENSLLEIECSSGDFSTRIDIAKNRKFRQGVPSVFKAKFFIEELTQEEKMRTTMHVLDGAGNVVTDAVQKDNILTFTPKNTKAKYTIIAQYTNDKGEVVEKKMSGETETNAVMAISHSAEVVRPGTAMSFSVSKMKYNFAENNPEYNLTPAESSEIKWNLNGVLIGTGKSIAIPGNMLMIPGKYVVEAYSKIANAFGRGAKKEDDDWHFEVKENDVVSFSFSGVPKVGKPVTVNVDKMVFADLLASEVIYWKSPLANGTGKSLKITPKVAGTFPISCKINNKTGAKQNITVVEAKITKGFWNDFGGSEISQASWGQKVDFCLKGENIEGEEIELAIYDSDNLSGDDLGYTNTENKITIKGGNDKTYASHHIELTKKIKERTTNSLSSEVKLYGKARLLGFEQNVLRDITPLEKTSKYLTVNDDRIAYRAIIGDQNGRAKHNPVDYDVKSWVYTNTTFPKGTKLKVKIFEKKGMFEEDVECKELMSSGSVNEDGTLVTEVNWGKLKDAKQNKKSKTYYASVYDEKDKRVLVGSSSSTPCNTILIPQSTLKKEASYTGAVMVGDQQIPQQKSGNCICSKYDLVWGGHKNVSCEFRKKVIDISIRQNFDPNHFMAVMYVESATTFSPSKIELKTVGYNKRGKPIREYTPLTKEEILKLPEKFSGAVGLIQFTPEAIDGLNSKYGLSLTKRKLALMSQLEQLDYAEKYIAMWKEINKITTKLTLADLYLVVFAPSKMNGSDDNTTLYAKDSKYYKKNESIDTDGKNGITKKELAARAYNSFAEGSGSKERDFECGQANSGPQDVNATDIVTYHIYSDGKIEKHIPKEIKEEYKKKYKYVFHKDGKEHILGVFNFRLTKEMNPGNVAGKKEIELVDVREFKGYSKDGVKLKFLTFNTSSERYYINPDCYAGLLGAMADMNIDYLGFNGFSNYEAKSTGGSSSHRNGEKGDLRYLSIDKDGGPILLQSANFDIPLQNEFNDTLYKFHWGRLELMYSEHFTYKGKSNYLLNHTKHMRKDGPKGYRHHHHLHLSGFDHSQVSLVKQ